jgi:hypothetical protein
VDAFGHTAAEELELRFNEGVNVALPSCSRELYETLKDLIAHARAVNNQHGLSGAIQDLKGDRSEVFPHSMSLVEIYDLNANDSCKEDEAIFEDAREEWGEQQSSHNSAQNL